MKKIIIVVSHKPSVVISADQIFVLEKGSIVDVGTHEMLLRDNDWYRGFSTN